MFHGFLVSSSHIILLAATSVGLDCGDLNVGRRISRLDVSYRVISARGVVNCRLVCAEPDAFVLFVQSGHAIKRTQGYWNGREGVVAYPNQRNFMRFDVQEGKLPENYLGNNNYLMCACIWPFEDGLHVPRYLGRFPFMRRDIATELVIYGSKTLRNESLEFRLTHGGLDDIVLDGQSMSILSRELRLIPNGPVAFRYLFKKHKKIEGLGQLPTEIVVETFHVDPAKAGERIERLRILVDKLAVNAEVVDVPVFKGLPGMLEIGRDRHDRQVVPGGHGLIRSLAAWYADTGWMTAGLGSKVSQQSTIARFAYQSILVTCVIAIAAGIYRRFFQNGGQV